MGLEWSADIIAPPEVDVPALQSAVQGALDALVNEISHWEPGSALSRFNAAAPGAWFDVPPHLWAVLSRGLAVAAATDGAFDPTLGALVDLWGFGPSGAVDAPPSPERIAEGLSRSGWRRLEVDPAGRRIRQPGGLHLDLSGIGKGYGVDLVAETIAAAGVYDCLVEIGGELRGAGVKPDGSPWWVRIETPPDEAEGEGIMIALHGLAVATSGDYRRFLRHEGRRLPHTLDARTGRPIETGVVSVTVIHRSAMEADVACTALSVLPAAEAMAYATAHDLAVVVLTREDDGRLSERISPAFGRMLD